MQSKRKAIDNAICAYGLMLILIPNLLLQRTASNVPTTFFYASYVNHIKIIQMKHLSNGYKKKR